jgi:N-acetylmuramoyl-L-alanine amidase
MSLIEGVLWLTLNTYHEARSDDQFSQIAVAHVVLNRAKNKNKTIKQVVLSPYQFSWTHLQSSYVPHDSVAFMQCLQSVLIAYQGYDFTKGATHYHKTTINPYWAKHYQYVTTVGSHHFYK